MNTSTILRAFFVLVPASVAASAQTITYTYTDLGPLTGYNASAAHGVGASGLVVGASLQGSSLPAATTWNASGATTSLGTLPGGTYSYGNAVSASGTVAGTSGASNSGNEGSQAFRWTAAGGMVGLVGPTAFYLTSASGINASGQVVGSATGNGPDVGCFWDVDGTLTTIGGHRFVSASAINDSGRVTGAFSEDDTVFHPYVWTMSGGLTDIGALPGNTRAFGNAINAAGAVVGSSALTSSSTSHAFLWTTDGGMLDLNSLTTPTFAGNVPNFILQSATGINDVGQIVGYGASFGLGPTRAFLLTPVPEPSTVAALCLGAVVMLRRRKRALA